MTAAVAQDPLTHWYWAAGLLISLIAATSPIWVPALKRWRARRAEDRAMVRNLHEAVVGKPATIDDPEPEPGMLVRLQRTEDACAEIKLEVTPNGGETDRLGDRVKRLGTDAETLKQGQKDLSKRTGVIEKHLGLSVGSTVDVS